MQRFSPIAFATLFFLSVSGCDSGPAPETKAAAAADAKAKEDADLKARLEARKAERLAKEEDKKKEEEAIQKKIEEVTVIPEDAKIPKKPADACKQVVEAQEAFMKRFHGDIDDAALTTQLGLIGKQCNEMAKPKVAMCQKFALDATTQEMEGRINDYLPACMKKYGEG